MRQFQADKVFKPRGVKLAVDLDPQSNNVLEIGAGVGKHAIGYAQKFPDSRIYAVEHSKERFEKFKNRISSHRNKKIDLDNLEIHHCDAEAFTVHFVPDHSLNKVFILYPNPYPKPAQSNKRWHNMPFMSCLISKLKPGGELTLVTNEQFYADESREIMDKEWGLRELAFTKISLESQPDFEPRTHFEKKYLLRGAPVFDLSWSVR